ncbi:MAG: SDR family NAD(P)-dependent oxidoreductase [Alphaproteobacteria bacterium]
MKGKVAVVTGAASGIGKATAERLGREGAKLVLADLADAEPVGEVVRGRGGEAIVVSTDVSDESQVKRLFARARADFGRVDVLVNAAGISRRTLAVDTRLEVWDRLLDVNLKGTFLCCREAIILMRGAGGGSIVNIASELALVAVPRLTAYAASKAGVMQLTRGLAVEHAKDGIRVNCVCPGPTDTPMLSRGIESMADPEAARRGQVEGTLFGRLGRPEEIANVIRFLASDEASFMTGSIVVADGGVTAH